MQVQLEQDQSSVGASNAATWRLQSRQKPINGPLRIQQNCQLRKQAQELACLMKRCKSKKMSRWFSGMTQIIARAKLLKSAIGMS
jgi:hypothetical protein